MRKIWIVVFALIGIVLVPSLGYPENVLNYEVWITLNRNFKVLYIKGCMDGFITGTEIIDDVSYNVSKECKLTLLNNQISYFKLVINDNLTAPVISETVDVIYRDPEYHPISVSKLVKYILEYYYNQNISEHDKKQALNDLLK